LENNTNNSMSAPLMTRAKICGITRLADARLAVDLGAAALGFNFYEKSPRCLAPSAAWDILRKLPALVYTVGVFVNWNAESVTALAKSLRLSAVQLHGEESPAVVAECARHFPVIKAFAAGPGCSIEPLATYRAACGFLLDAAPAKDGRKEYGGTGKLADWKFAARAAKLFPVLLAGGLRPENVAAAIAAVRPDAVDVSSGVEARPGIKDPGKLRAFLAAVARANGESRR
jgi:phosphoribosylanthranilate isomerase